MKDSNGRSHIEGFLDSNLKDLNFCLLNIITSGLVFFLDKIKHAMEQRAEQQGGKYI